MISPIAKNNKISINETHYKSRIVYRNKLEGSSSIHSNGSLYYLRYLSICEQLSERLEFSDLTIHSRVLWFHHFCGLFQLNFWLQPEMSERLFFRIIKETSSPYHIAQQWKYFTLKNS